MKKIGLFALAILAIPTSSMAGLWISYDGDFYLEGTKDGLTLYSEEEVYPRLACSVPAWPTESRPVDMTCNDGSVHSMAVKDAETLLLRDVEFYKVK